MRWLLDQTANESDLATRLMKAGSSSKSNTGGGDSFDSDNYVLDPTSLEDQPWNFGELNDLMKLLLFILTLYLLLYDLKVFLSSIALCSRGENKSIGSVIAFVGIFLHLHVLVSIASADDLAIVDIDFWRNQTWVAFAVWFRVIVTYLGEI